MYQKNRDECSTAIWADNWTVSRTAGVGVGPRTNNQAWGGTGGFAITPLACYSKAIHPGFDSHGKGLLVVLCPVYDAELFARWLGRRAVWGHTLMCDLVCIIRLLDTVKYARADLEYSQYMRLVFLTTGCRQL
mgnify:CR=1 FL=1